MKSMKRVAGILLAILILAASIVPAMAGSAYTSLVSTDGKTIKFIEKLHVTAAGTAFPNVTYTFTTASDITGYSDGTTNYFVQKDLAANTGKIPTNTKLGEATFSPAADGVGVKTAQREMEFDISGLTFTEPGIYYWSIKKAKTTGSAAKATNEVEDLYLIVRVNDVSGVLTPSYSINTDLTTSSKREEIIDRYPVTNEALTISKLVDGNQGSKDQYFKYTVNLSGLQEIAGTKLPVTTDEGPGTPSATLYGETPNYSNPREIEVLADGTGTATFWLKHGQNVVIEGLLKESKFTVTEDTTTDSGYTVTHKVIVGDAQADTIAPVESNTTGVQTMGDEEIEVRYTNTKATSVPTGVNAQAAAPLFGVLLAGALLALLLLGKRKNDEA